MKYLKHMTNASDDDFIEILESRFGLEGYARWWKMLEVIGAGMGKHQNNPFAVHEIGQWCAYLRGKRKVVYQFINFCVENGKIDVEFLDSVSGTKSLHSRNEPGMFPESNRFIMKIVCPKILDLRDNWSRRSVVTTEQLPTQAEADKESKYKPLTPLPEPPPKKEPEKPAPPRPAFHEKKGFQNGFDFAAAATACCRILNKKRLSSLDTVILERWIEVYDFSGFVLPFVIEKTEKFMENNLGNRPGTLSYFTAGLREKNGK